MFKQILLTLLLVVFCAGAFVAQEETDICLGTVRTDTIFVFFFSVFSSFLHSWLHKSF